MSGKMEERLEKLETFAYVMTLIVTATLVVSLIFGVSRCNEDVARYDKMLEEGKIGPCEHAIYTSNVHSAHVPNLLKDCKELEKK